MESYFSLKYSLFGDSRNLPLQTFFSPSSSASNNYHFGCDHHDVHRCLQLTLGQLKNFRDHRLTTLQLHAAQKQLVGQLGVASANLENAAITPAKGWLRLGAPEPLEETCRRVEAVTADEILAVANELMTEERLRCVMIQ